MRMMAKSTSKMEFFDKNKEMAMGLAVKEMADAKEKAKETQVHCTVTIFYYCPCVSVLFHPYLSFLIAF